MKRTRVMMILAGAAVVWCAAPLGVMAAPASAGTAASTGGWGKAMDVPGLTQLSAGTGGTITGLSCSSPGNCAAGGDYNNASGNGEAFVVSEKDGWWGKAIEVPGLAALNTGGQAAITALSCGSAGNCAAGGFYTGSSPAGGAFVVSEKNGSWGKAIEVPGIAALRPGATSDVASVSCASAGNCAAGGSYSKNADTQAFVVSESNGSWGKAIEVPGSAALNGGEDATVGPVSCASAGNCAAAGSYRNANGIPEGFVVSEKNGCWGKAIEVPGSATLPDTNVNSLSCTSAGNCGGAGWYSAVTDSGPAVISERNGTWGKPILVPGTEPSAINSAQSVSCTSAGNCAAGGAYAAKFNGPYQAFVDSENNGWWGKSIEVPGSVALNAGGNAAVLTVSCQSAGNCAAGGYYTDGSSHQQAFVANESNGWWGKAIEVPGSAALNAGGFAFVGPLSCTSAGYCAAAGYYTNSAGNDIAFLVSRR
jgi:hypothetical protein